MVQLPPEVLSVIARYTDHTGLVLLCRTSKALQRAAEPKLYDAVLLRDAPTAYLFSCAIAYRDGHRGPLVKRLYIYQENRRMALLPRRNFADMPAEFWQALQLALTKMTNLDFLMLQDPSCSHAWLLDHPDIRFQLREAQLWLPWGAHLVAFLEGQHKLRTLAITDTIGEGAFTHSLASSALKNLTTFNGPLLVAAELVFCRLERMQVSMDDDTIPLLPTVLADLSRYMPTLRSLSLVPVPERALPEILPLITGSAFAPSLRYLGHIPWPVSEWHHIQSALMKLPSLEILEVDMHSWDPSPHQVFQRSLLFELRMYAPKLRAVAFWIAPHRFIWTAREDTWTHVHHMGRHPLDDSLWRA